MRERERGGGGGRYRDNCLTATLPIPSILFDYLRRSFVGIWKDISQECYKSGLLEGLFECKTLKHSIQI